jgi:hypothetical protein
MPKENYFVITLEPSFLALSLFFLIEVTGISAMDVSVCVADWAPRAYNHALANLRLIFIELAVKCATINSKNLGRVSMIAARFFQDA